MFSFRRWFLGFCVSTLLIIGTSFTTAEAPQITLQQLKQQTEWSVRDVLMGIELLCEEYQFPYFELLKDLAWKESHLGQLKRCGDGGLSCGLYQYRLSTWEFLQKKYNRFDLRYDNYIDQIEMTILALKDGYWYFWGPLTRKYSTNPIEVLRK